MFTTRTIQIEAPTQQEQEVIKQQLVSAHILVSNIRQVSRWLNFDVDVKIVTQVLYLFPAKAEVQGAENLSFFEELEEYEIEDLILFRQELAVYDIQTVYHPYSGWQWALLLDYFEGGLEQKRVIRLNKAAACEKIVFPDGSYVLQRIVTERSAGCVVLMPVKIIPASPDPLEVGDGTHPF